MNKILLIIAFGAVALSCFGQAKKFVKIEEGEFVLKNKPYRFMGANFWQGMYLGMPGPYGDREQLKKELDQLKALGVTNLRVLGSSEGHGKYQIVPTLLEAPGKYNEQVFEGLDYLLNEMRKRKMKAVVVLNNFWMWSGGMPQYVSWAQNRSVELPDIEGGGSWEGFIDYSLQFFEDSVAQQYFLDHLKVLTQRKNAINGKKYIKDPTIMAWQLCNEPRGYYKQEAYRRWIAQTSAYIQNLDENHLVCVGAEGNTGTDYSGVDLYLDNQFESVDYATVHLWIQNWSWFDPNKPETFEEAVKKSEQYLEDQLEKANQLNKPIVVEEFGVSRDSGLFESQASVTYRNRYFQYVFDFVIRNIQENGRIMGCNFWSWSGDAQPGIPGGMWRPGDDYTGDPPHEKQGWYSVYSIDTSTHEIIRQASDSIRSMR